MTKPFIERKFSIPELKGISTKSIEEHLGLYSSYVKNYNALEEAMAKLMGNAENNLTIAELHRRLSFEFGGMRLHEYYFAQLEGGARPLNVDGALAKAVDEKYPSDNLQGRLVKLLTNVTSTRGPGWAILYYDPVSKKLLTGFSGEQHVGHFVTLPIILALDVWEHTYILDHGAAGKGKYVEAFFANLNWDVVEGNFLNATK